MLTQIDNSPSTSPRPVRFYRTTDGGQNWTLGNDGVSGPLDLAYLSPDGTGFIIQSRFKVSGDIAFQIGHLYHITTDGGLTWFPLRKTDGDCGYGRFLKEIVPGVVMSVGQQTVVLTK